MPVENGAPATNVQFAPMTVPLRPLPDESFTPPQASLKPQRPSKPVPVGISTSLPARICAAVRATFQMRDSSSVPPKKPAATPVELSALPRAACWMLSDRGGRPMVIAFSWMPFRYSRSVVPS